MASRSIRKERRPLKALQDDLAQARTELEKMQSGYATYLQTCETTRSRLTSHRRDAYNAEQSVNAAAKRAAIAVHTRLVEALEHAIKAEKAARAKERGTLRTRSA